MGCFSTSNATPAAPTYQNVTNTALGTQYAEAPGMYSEQAQFSPMYAALGAGNLNTAMTGPTGMLSSVSAERGANVSDLNNLGPSASNAVLNMNPSQAQLLALLNGQGSEGMAAGTNLTPEEQAQMDAQNNNAYSARGMNATGSNMPELLMSHFDLGNQLLQRRQAFGSNLAGMNNSYVTQPAIGAATGISPAMAAAMSSNGMAGPTLWNPNAGNQLAAGTYQDQMALAASKPTGFQSMIALSQALSNFGGSFSGSIPSGGGGAPPAGGGDMSGAQEAVSGDAAW